MPARHLVIGRTGEDIAAAYLQRIGYVVLARNVRIGRDEIDIIARDTQESVLVFVEVKTRKRSSSTFPPELNADERKISKLARAARAWIATTEYEGGYRLDLICVAERRVQHHFRELQQRIDEDLQRFS